jgi:hypothetical protein
MESITHARPENWQKFLETLGEKEKEVHLMGEAIMGSSYYMEKTHAYREWLAKNPGEKAGAVASGVCSYMLK